MKKQPIGFMDSGVGGLTALKEALQQLPNEDLIFIGDQARLPYGEKPAEIVKGFAWQMTNFLLATDIKALVVACNTATAAALPDLQAQLNIPVIGVIEPGSQMAAAITQNQNVGVIATTGTIQSGAYAKQLGAITSQIKVTGLAVPEFVMMIEANQLTGDAVQARVNALLTPLQTSPIDTLILGCTHFPLLAPAIQAAVGHNVTLVDPAKAAVAKLKQILTAQNQLNTSQQAGTLQTFTTGNVADFSTIARQWLKNPTLVAQQATIQGEKNDGPNR